jgi:trehalose 6-phosphate synthase
VSNKQAFERLIRDALSQFQLIVVANAQPYVRRTEEDRVVWSRAAGGIPSALDPIMQVCGGVWVAGGGHTGPQESDTGDRVSMPPDQLTYKLRRVRITEAQEKHYHFHLSNEGMWPLCHAVFVRPVYSSDDWEAYREVNAIFADAVLEEAGSRPALVFIQDYHLGLLPRLLKRANRRLVVAHFWHIPWPSANLMGTFPWRPELIDGLLGNDLIAFQLREHCLHFLDSVARSVEAKVDYEKLNVSRQGNVTTVRPIPIGIDCEANEVLARSPGVERAMEEWRQRLGLNGAARLGVGMERLDYTKGIPERLRGLNRFLEKHAEFRGCLTFVQACVPSRLQIVAYQRLAEEIKGLVEEINRRWETSTWRPIHHYSQYTTAVEMLALHRLADFCFVSSLDDGMNLVAKEFVSSRFDEDGVLILSEFAGASHELTEALIVNPFSEDAIAEAIHRALTIPQRERTRRMRGMRFAVADNDVYRWASTILHDLLGAGLLLNAPDGSES